MDMRVIENRMIQLSLQIRKEFLAYLVIVANSMMESKKKEDMLVAVSEDSTGTLIGQFCE
jgi:hypothetical protein